MIRVALACAALAAPLVAQSPNTWPTRAWPRATFESRNIDSVPWISLDSAIRAGAYGNADHLLVIRRGAVVFDRRYPRDYRAIAAGRQSNIGCGPGACAGRTFPAEYNYFDPDTHPFHRGGPAHSVQSVTKSVLATVFGAVMHTGAIRSVNEPLLAHLGAKASIATDPRLKDATLAHLLTMRTGIEWHEQDRPLDSTNTTVQLEWSNDWVRFTLSQPMDAAPGTKWAYNSGGSHLIGAVIAEATKRNPLDVARELLFAPLGITNFHWKITPEGLPDGEGGLYLDAESLAKIGLLYLRDGVWDGRRILPSGWAQEATRKHAFNNAATPLGYGYQWWRIDQTGPEIWAAMGFGGNFLVVVPDQELIMVALAWNVYGGRAPGLLNPIVQAARRSVR